MFIAANPTPDESSAPSMRSRTPETVQHVFGMGMTLSWANPDATGRSGEFLPLVGRKLGKCQLESVLGKGGACTIYRARQESLDVPVAVKVLLPEEGSRWELSYEKLKTEARLLARLNHPHVVRILDFEDDPTLPYLVLELVEGGTLHELIRKRGRLSSSHAIALILQATDGLSAMWKEGVVHRDVKPANILLTPEGTAKVADLGQAVRATESGHEVVGTPGYVAPEQCLTPHAIDFRADIYGLGATLYEAVTGQPPYSGRCGREVLLQQINEMPPPPRLLVPQIDRNLSNVILTMLARNPADRYGSAKEIRVALERRSANLWADRGPSRRERAKLSRQGELVR
jgi:serine/threonine protein kinase